jgi:hypothetical protein
MELDVSDIEICAELSAQLSASTNPGAQPKPHVPLTKTDD